MSHHGIMPGNCQGLFSTTIQKLKYIQAVVNRYCLSAENAQKGYR